MFPSALRMAFFSSGDSRLSRGINIVLLANGSFNSFVLLAFFIRWLKKDSFGLLSMYPAIEEGFNVERGS